MWQFFVQQFDKSLVARCHSFNLFLHYSSRHTIFIYTTRRVPLLLSSLLPLGGGPLLGCRAEIWTRAYRTASRRATIWATPHPHPPTKVFLKTTMCNGVNPAEGWHFWTKINENGSGCLRFVWNLVHLLGYVRNWKIQNIRSLWPLVTVAIKIFKMIVTFCVWRFSHNFKDIKQTK
jgi:hypothetical protein